jgi:extracellular matrix regulatory protein A
MRKPQQETTAATPVVLNVGFYNFVVSGKILAMIRSDSAPMRRMVQEARKSGTLIDATQGRKTKSVLFLDGGVTVTSALSQETLARRLGGKEAQPLAGTAEEEAAAAEEAKEVEAEEDVP